MTSLVIYKLINGEGWTLERVFHRTLVTETLLKLFYIYIPIYNIYKVNYCQNYTSSTCAVLSIIINIFDLYGRG